jgi:hypothetical protein
MVSSVSPEAMTIGVPPWADQPAALPATATGAALRRATADWGGGSGCERTLETAGADVTGVLATRPMEPVVAGSRAVDGAWADLKGLEKGASVKRIVSDEQALTPKAKTQTADARTTTLGRTDPVWLRMELALANNATR